MSIFLFRGGVKVDFFDKDFPQNRCFLCFGKSQQVTIRTCNFVC